MYSFTAKIDIIGVNPYVLLPAKILKAIFNDAGKDKGAIPVKGTINNHSFIQHLVKYSGKWRLYLNTPMRKGSKADVGDTVSISISFDEITRETLMPEKLAAALLKNKKASKVFDGLSPSLQKEIKRYINNLKNEETIDKNVARAINFLLGKERFIGRDHP